MVTTTSSLHEQMKIVIPAAGLGTRFLPFTKAVPKEMLPILNKPAIHYIIEECIAAHSTDICIIINKEKIALKHYLSPDPILETILKKNNKEHMLADTNTLIASAQFTYIEQIEPLGLGHAVSLARNEIGNNNFCVILPDDIIFGIQPAIGELITIATQECASVIAVQEVPQEEIPAYGAIAIKRHLSQTLVEIDHIVEKPQPQHAPSNWAVIGRYVFMPSIFNAINIIGARTHKEIQLTDAISHLCNNNERVLAYKLPGTRFDIGTPVGWLAVNNYIASK